MRDREEPDFASEIERQARRWVDRADRSPKDFVVAGVERELRLLLMQVDKLRDHHHRTRDHFGSAESTLRLEMDRMDANQWWYDIHREQRWQDRRRLQDDHRAVVAEGLRTESGLELRLQTLQERLLVVFGRAEVLAGSMR